MAASAAAASALFAAVLDCNPKLFLYDRLFYDPSNSYRGKSVWIVGSSSGIGNEMAVQLARLKCQTLILSSRNEQALDELKRQCQEVHSSCECVCIPMDVTDEKRMNDAVNLVHERHPSLDMVVLNAGAGQLSPGLETAPEVFQGIMQANAIWPMIFLPMLLNRTKDEASIRQSPIISFCNKAITPRIVVTSSIAALIPVPLSTAYAAAKAAVQQYFLSIATERPDLTIDLVCPGPIDTNFHSNHIGKKGNHVDKQEFPNSQAIEVQSSEKKSPLKMPVERCAHLMLAAAAMSHRGGVSESWIVKQPTLTALYLNQWAPGLLRPFLGKVGKKRIQIWRDGLDLYDPLSWSNPTSPRKRG